MILSNRFFGLFVLGLLTVLAGCAQVSAPEADEVADTQPELVDNDPLVQLAPGVFYYEHDGGVRIKMNYLEFDETSLDAIRAKEAELGTLSAQGADKLVQERSERWASELAVAEKASALLSSEEVQTSLRTLESEGGLSTQAFGCDNTATARSTGSRDGAKADARASCNGSVNYATNTEAIAEAEGDVDRDRDSGGSNSRASAAEYGDSFCSSSAEAESVIEALRVDIPAGRDTDRHRGC